MITYPQLEIDFWLFLDNCKHDSGCMSYMSV